MTTEIRNMKALLRKEIAAKLQSIPVDSLKAQGDAVLRKLQNHPRFLEAERVSVYLSTPTEINTSPIIEHFLTAGKTVFVPRFERGNPLMQMLKLHSLQDYRSLPEIMWGIRQPESAEGREDPMETGNLDLVITPGVAFTTSGLRLGHGRGYYDSFFHNYQAKFAHQPYSIALAFREQILDTVPVTEHDYTLNEVISSD